MAEHRIFKARFSDIYPLYVQKALRKGRTQDEVDAVILWLTGYTPGQGLGPRAVPGRNGVRLHLLPQTVQRARHAPGNVSRRKDREIQHCSPPPFVPRSIFSMGLPLASSSMSLSR